MFNALPALSVLHARKEAFNFFLKFPVDCFGTEPQPGHLLFFMLLACWLLLQTTAWCSHTDGTI